MTSFVRVVVVEDSASPRRHRVQLLDEPAQLAVVDEAVPAVRRATRAP